jgi:hypothetical protein
VPWLELLELLGRIAYWLTKPDVSEIKRRDHKQQENPDHIPRRARLAWVFAQQVFQERQVNANAVPFYNAGTSSACVEPLQRSSDDPYRPGNAASTSSRVIGD